jgi:hypothetical protein
VASYGALHNETDFDRASAALEIAAQQFQDSRCERAGSNFPAWFEEQVWIKRRRFNSGVNVREAKRQEGLLSEQEDVDRAAQEYFRGSRGE